MLALGLASFAGCLGLGALLLRLGGLRWPTPYLQVGALLLGLQLESLAVQGLAMAQCATREALIAVWCGMLLAGIAGLEGLWRGRSPRAGPRVPMVAVLLLALAGAINLAAAVAPSSKIDELYYVMPFAGRLVLDQGLHLYRMPVESSVLVQMGFAFAAAPLHALGFPDAANIVSWACMVTLVWFGWCLLREQVTTPAAAYCIVASISIGAYPLVFGTTAGSHAFGDLALAAAVVALVQSDRLLKICGPVRYVLLVSLLTLGAASAKLSLVPVSLALLALGGAAAWRADAGMRARLVAAGAAAWLIFWVPLALFDWLSIGSPFGPLLADPLGGRFFARGAFAAYAEQSRAAGRGPWTTILFDSAAAMPLLVWLAALGLMWRSALSARLRWQLGALFVLQAAIVLWLLPYHPRFLGGLTYGLAICFALYLRADLLGRPRLVSAALAIAVLPWLAGQLVYGSQFVPVALGLESRKEFLGRHVAFFVDFERLDGLLPRDAVLLAPGMRAPAAYAPRPMVFDVADLPADRPAFLFTLAGVGAQGTEPLGPAIYANARARSALFRRWWVAPVESELAVYPVRRTTSLR